MIDVISFVLFADDAYEENRLNFDFNSDFGHKVRVSNNVADHLSERVDLGSTFKPTEIKTPEKANSKLLSSALRLLI